MLTNKVAAAKFMLHGQSVMGTFDPATGTYQYNGQDVTKEATPIPPASVTIQDQIATAQRNQPAWVSALGPGVSGAAANQADPRVGGLSPNGLYEGALKYLNTGSLGWLRGTPQDQTLMQQAIFNKVGAMAQTVGLSQPQFMAAYKANSHALLNQVDRYATIHSFLQTADANTVLLSGILPKVPNTASPLLNTPLRAFANKVQGNPTMSQMAVYLASIQSEYGRILNTASLSGVLTVAAHREAQVLISPSATVNQMLAAVSALNQEGTNRVRSITDQIHDLVHDVGTGHVGGPAAVTPPGTGAMPSAGTPTWDPKTQTLVYPKTPGGQ